TNVLYRSVALVDRPSTDSFLRTLDSNPFLANKVNHLVISLAEDAQYDGSDRLGDSLALLEVLKRCAKTISALQIHPLHDQVRPQLFAVMKSMESLEILVCSPRFFSPSPAQPAGGGAVGHQGNHPVVPGQGPLGGSGFYSRTDLLELALPAPLHTLELDFESSWSAEVLPFHNGLHLNGLRKLRLRADMDEDVLWQVLRQCTELEVCEMYFERLLARDQTTNALLPSVRTMKSMLFLCNPTLEDLAHFDPAAQPIFDRLLPFYAQLETLSISATELSSSVFRLIPPSLLALEIQAFNHVSTFIYTPQLAADLRNPAYATGLKSLRVHDAAEAWDEQDIHSLAAACEARGIDFTFRPDSEAGA
ncbi:hypothetical protein JCM8547_002832, partial [Rhodosporidiobolus lusitaniae]